jgi:hypothetical protein
MLVNYMEQRPLKVDTRLATQILRCSIKNVQRNLYLQTRTPRHYKKKKNKDTNFRNRHPTLVDMFRSPDRCFRIRYSNRTGISLFYNTSAMPCLSLIFIVPFQQNSTSTFLLIYFSYLLWHLTFTKKTKKRGIPKVKCTTPGH